jgi:hypothetical protein
MLKIILIIIVIIIYNLQGNEPVTINSDVNSIFPIVYDPSLSINKAPIQNKINSSKNFVEFNDYKITPMANFQLIGKVLSEKHYSTGRETELSPVDLALGWGPMAVQNNIDAISISQSRRWYRWRAEKFPIPRKEIETNSANMHFIPTNETIDTLLKSIKKGDTVKLKGYLVQINGNDGWRWTSSLTRNDTGKGACEVILLEDIQKI